MFISQLLLNKSSSTTGRPLRHSVRLLATLPCRTMESTDFAEKFQQLTEHWRPRAVAELNGQEVRIVKFRGVFPWHHHADADEMFLVWKGSMKIEFRNDVVELKAGQMHVIPRGVEHRTMADDEVEVILFEPAGTRNTGNVEDPVFTAPLSAKL
jgi:mannose-6-phosphate isomerase-like protein (cupin superfamily)